jgi:hypothetical protein
MFFGTSEVSVAINPGNYTRSFGRSVWKHEVSGWNSEILEWKSEVSGWKLEVSEVTTQSFW